jgi:hypothetical protein
MIYAQLTVSTILILCGLLVNYNPNLLAGYNTLSEKEKKLIDIKKLSAFFRNILTALGVFGLILHILLDFCNVNENYILLINSSLVLITIFCASIYANYNFKL